MRTWVAKQSRQALPGLADALPMGKLCSARRSEQGKHDLSRWRG